MHISLCRILIDISKHFNGTNTYHFHNVMYTIHYRNVKNIDQTMQWDDNLSTLLCDEHNPLLDYEKPILKQ